jgi:3-hydroxybutyryl-CoA dehydrogenase
MPVESIAIVGPGRMGVGIATAVLMANQGHAVILIDTKKRDRGRKAELLNNASKEVRTNLEVLNELGMLPADVSSLVGYLSVEPGLKGSVAGSSIVFEALPEEIGVKQDFYEAIGPLIDEQTVIASATSTFHLDVFWDACSKPGNIVSAHWLNPAFLIPLVEICYGNKTDEWALSKLLNFIGSIGKIPVKMKTSPGFIVPRIQAAAMNEAIRILEEGVTTAKDIDTAIKAGFGFRLCVMGIIEFVDLGGVDILCHAGEYLNKKLKGDHFKPPRLVTEKLKKGEVGPRSGKGFYDYHDVNVHGLFNDRYQGFVELLNLFKRSKHLRFEGGLHSNGPLKQEPIK